MIFSEATQMDYDDIITVLILPQNKENCWNDSANSIKFHKKTNLFLNWNLLIFFIVDDYSSTCTNAEK